MIMNLTAIDSKEWQLGKTKIFLRNKAHEPMEDLRKKLLNGKSLIIQRNWKRHLSRKGKFGMIHLFNFYDFI